MICLTNLIKGDTMVLPHCKHCKGFVVDFYLAKLTTHLRVVFLLKKIIINFYKKVLTSI